MGKYVYFCTAYRAVVALTTVICKHFENVSFHTLLPVSLPAVGGAGQGQHEPQRP